MSSTNSWATSASLATPERLVVGGLPVAVYGLPALTVPASASSGLAVLFLLHGRGESSQSDYLTTLATKLVESARDKRAQVSPLAAAGEAQQKRAKDLLVVTFDQRNHGHRLVDAQRNMGWMEGGRKRAAARQEKGIKPHELDNEGHAYDMMAMQTGTSRDVSFLIDFLPPSLFRNDERTVTDWYCSGISLGGHATWLALAHDPRITLGVPIIGSPSTHTLLSHRAQNFAAPAGPLPLAAPIFPKSLLAVFDRFDPASPSLSLDRWKGKSILVLSGEEDKLVNFVHGKSGVFVETLKGVKGCHVEAYVQPKAGHECTPEMMERTCEFVWRCGLNASGSAHPQQQQGPHGGLAHELASKGFVERSALAVRRRLAEIKKRKNAGVEEYDDDAIAASLGLKPDPNRWTPVQDEKMRDILRIMSETAPSSEYWRKVKNWDLIAKPFGPRSKKEVEARMKKLEAQMGYDRDEY